MNIKKIAASLVLSTFAFSALAATPTITTPEQDLAATLKATYPKTPFGSVKETPFKGIFEITMGKNIAYTDVYGKYFIFGHIFEMSTQKDLTADALNILNKIDYGALPFDKAIKIVKGDGSRKFAVFSDPECPFCKQLETNLDGVNNYTMYVFMFPLEQLHPGTTKLAKSIWCSKDNGTAWHKATAEGVMPKENTTCANYVADTQALGEKLGVTGTPTLIRPDGKLVPGALRGADLENFISGK
jgi:thiol:disulfide interchange protein DsbC